MLKACLNGSRGPREHPALPVTPEQLAADAARVVAAGANAIHLHAKDNDGADSVEGEYVDRTVTAVRAVTRVPIGVTTGAWTEPDPAARVRAIGSWTVLPDFASVNWHEPGAERVATALLDRGIAVEAGLWHADAVRAWTPSPLRGTCLRVLLELPDGLDATQAVTEADDLLARVRHTGADLPVLLHGEGMSTWPCLLHAVRLGLDSRIGLEDTLHRPDGTEATDNADLVRLASATLPH